MRRARFLLAASSLAFTGIAIWTSGCGTFYDDCIGGLCGSAVKPRVDGGTGGHIDPSCAGSPTDTDEATKDLKLYNPDCAVFAWAGATNPAPDGTMGNPFPTLQKAIDSVSIDGKDKGKWVIACNKDDFTENVTTPNSAQIFGGFDCSTLNKWAVDPTMKKTTLVGKDSNLVTLTMANAGMGVNVLLQDFSVEATSATVTGNSSIAMVVDDIVASLTRCDVTAGDGMDGKDGEPPTGTAMKGADAAMPTGATMNACINPGSLLGGSPGMPTACDDGMSIGGKGGKGGIIGTNNGDADPGADGQPPDAVSGKGGAAAAGVNDCTNGITGKNGNPGGPGEAGPAASSPEILTVSGLAGGNGGDGAPGSRAQGGGGGGGAKAGKFCAPGNIDGNGASGGGAGSGGCGGKGGGGGKAGGSSIAVISLGIGLTLNEVSLMTGKGGNGGGGVVGQTGGAPGLGNLGGADSGFVGSKPGCKGGDGGRGGDGGPGGGGRGGHSMGIAYASTPTAAPALKTYTPGTPGSGGQGTNTGAVGSTGACWDFAKKAPCM